MTAHLSKRALKKAHSEKATAARMTKFTRIVLEQSGLCFFCGEVMGGDCTREHLLAQSLGGGNERSNLRAAHGECNSAAGSLPVSDKMRLRAVGHSEGREAMLQLAKQMRRADARMAFSGETMPKPRKTLKGNRSKFMQAYVLSQKKDPEPDKIKLGVDIPAP